MFLGGAWERDDVAEARDQAADQRDLEAADRDDVARRRQESAKLRDQAIRDRAWAHDLGDQARALRGEVGGTHRALTAAFEQAQIDREVAVTAAEWAWRGLADTLDSARKDRMAADADRVASQHDRQQAAGDRAASRADRDEACRERDQRAIDAQLSDVEIPEAVREAELVEE